MTARNIMAFSKADWIVESPKEALATAARLVQDDLVLMVKRDGKPTSRRRFFIRTYC